MPRSRPPYPPEFRAEAVRLVREGGRTPEELARDLGCTGQTIRNWLKQADLDAGRRHDGLTTAERDELRRLQAENRTLRMERDLLEEFAKSAGSSIVNVAPPAGLLAVEMLVPSLLDQDVQHNSVLVDGSPQPVTLAADF